MKFRNKKEFWYDILAYTSPFWALNVSISTGTQGFLNEFIFLRNRCLLTWFIIQNACIKELLFALVHKNWNNFGFLIVLRNSWDLELLIWLCLFVYVVYKIEVTICYAIGQNTFICIGFSVTNSWAIHEQLYYAPMLRLLLACP
jgi:hypothetical protein